MSGRRTMMVLATALLAGSLLATGAQAHGGGGTAAMARDHYGYGRRGFGGYYDNGIRLALHLRLLSGDPIRKLPARGLRNLKGLTWRTGEPRNASSLRWATASTHTPSF